MNDDLQKVQKIVNQIKKNEEVGVRYMKSWEYEWMIRKEAELEGRETNLIERICKKLRKGKEWDVIADELEEDIQNVIRICTVALDFAPDYDVEKIYEALQTEEM